MADFRTLIVGAGNMGKAWAKNLLSIPSQVAIAGWVDIVPDTAHKAADELEIRNAHIDDNFARALAEVKPDLVIDASIPESHKDITITALNCGVPVLGEKPMADSLVNAKAMVDASEKSGKLYMVSQNYRYDPQLKALRRLIADYLGNLGILKSDYYMGVHIGGFREQMQHPLLIDMAIHTFDMARYLSGSDPIAVYCDEFNPAGSWYNGNSSANAIFEMTGGLRYTYQGSWTSEGHHTSWPGQWRAVGENGTAIWDGSRENSPVAEVVESSDGFFSKHKQVSGVHEEVPIGIAGSIQDFLNALQTGQTPMGECHDNIKSLAMVFAAIESAETKTRIEITI